MAIYYVDYYQDGIDPDDSLMDQVQETVDEHLCNMQIDLKNLYKVDMVADIPNQCIIVDDRDINRIKLTHGMDILVEYSSIEFLTILAYPDGEVSFTIEIEWSREESHATTK